MRMRMPQGIIVAIVKPPMRPVATSGVEVRE